MPPIPPLTRDRLTVTSYAMIGVWALYLYFVGPATPLISEELGIGMQLAGITSLMLGAGLIASGFAGPAPVRWLGRGASAVACAALLAAGTLALSGAPVFGLVLAAVAVCTLAGALLLNLATAALTDRHGAAASTAITEGQAIAGWVGVLSPVLIGGMVAAGLGWRAAAVVVAVVAGGLALVLWPSRSLLGRRVRAAVPAAGPVAATTAPAELADPQPAGASTDAVSTAATGPRPAASTVRFAWSLVGVVVAAGMETAIQFWGAVLIADNTRVGLGTTTALLSALIAGIAVGRTAGSFLTRRIGERSLVLGSLAVTAVGFAVLWRSPVLWLAGTALAVTGLGLALLFPLAVGLAMVAAGSRTDRAAAIVSIVLGASVAASPFLLAALSGWVGVSRAFLIVPVLLAVGVVAVFGAAPGRAAGRAARH